MSSLMNIGALMLVSSNRRTITRKNHEPVTFVEHPYRFVSLIVLMLLNVLSGTFISGFIPLVNTIILVS
jgi:hypothetical protein